MRRLHRLNMTAVACAWLMSSSTRAATAPPAVPRVSITNYPSAAAAISDAQAADILDKASRLLQRNDGRAANGDGDVACGVRLQQDGRVTPFADVILNGIVHNGDDFTRVCQQPGLLHVVNQLNWCGPLRDNLLGCSVQQPACIVVVRYSGLLTGANVPVLWAHEYGHTRGLWHSCEEPKCTSSEADRLMHPVIAEAHVKIGATECRAYRR